MGTWHTIGVKQNPQDTTAQTTNLPLITLTFKEDRGATSTLPGGRTDDAYQWFLKDQYIWLRVRGKSAVRSERKDIPAQLRGGQASILWPDNNRDVVLLFERLSELARGFPRAIFLTS